jgi:hypothetical protein
LYVCTYEDYSRHKKSEAVCTGELPELLVQLEEKYFDYFVFNIVDCGINCGLPRSGARRRALAQTISNAQGLDINSPRSAENYPSVTSLTSATRRSQQCSGARQ